MESFQNFSNVLIFETYFFKSGRSLFLSRYILNLNTLKKNLVVVADLIYSRLIESESDTFEIQYQYYRGHHPQY